VQAGVEARVDCWALLTMSSDGIREWLWRPKGWGRGSHHHKQNVKDLLMDIQDEVNWRVVSLNYYVTPNFKDLEIGLKFGR
jgi:hypothetical protein